MAHRRPCPRARAPGCAPRSVRICARALLAAVVQMDVDAARRGGPRCRRRRRAAPPRRGRCRWDRSRRSARRRPCTACSRSSAVPGRVTHPALGEGHHLDRHDVPEPAARGHARPRSCAGRSRCRRPRGCGCGASRGSPPGAPAARPARPRAAPARGAGAARCRCARAWWAPPRAAATAGPRTSCRDACARRPGPAGGCRGRRRSTAAPGGGTMPGATRAMRPSLGPARRPVRPPPWDAHRASTTSALMLREYRQRRAGKSSGRPAARPTLTAGRIADAGWAPGRDVVRCPEAPEEETMRPVHSRKWLTLALVLAGALARVLAIRLADAQGGGTLVVGLDQEPPTLDPHASPSAVTYQIIASVAENLLYRGPDGKLVPWLAESWTVARGRPQRDLQAAPRREVPRRHAVQRRRGEVQLRPDRGSEVQGGRLPRRARQLRRLEGARRVHGAGALRDPVRALPELGGLRGPLRSCRRRRCARAATQSTRARWAPGPS